MIFRNQASSIKQSNRISRDELLDIYGLNSYEFTQKLRDIDNKDDYCENKRLV